MSDSNPADVTPCAHHIDVTPARGQPRFPEVAVGLRARSLEIRTACAARVDSVVSAVGELRNTLRGTSRDETDRLTAVMWRAPNLVFRRVLPGAVEPGRGPCNLFCGAGVEMIAGPGQSVARLPQESWYGRVHPDDLPAYRVAEAQRRRSGKPYTMEYRIRHALTGEARWVRETAWAEWASDLAQTVLNSHLLDVTERKRAELELRASEERYRRLVEERDTYICCFGPPGPSAHLRQRRLLPALRPVPPRPGRGRRAQPAARRDGRGLGGPSGLGVARAADDHPGAHGRGPGRDAPVGGMDRSGHVRRRRRAGRASGVRT